MIPEGTLKRGLDEVVIDVVIRLGWLYIAKFWVGWIGRDPFIFDISGIDYVGLATNLLRWIGLILLYSFKLALDCFYDW